MVVYICSPSYLGGHDSRITQLEASLGSTSNKNKSNRQKEDTTYIDLLQRLLCKPKNHSLADNESVFMPAPGCNSFLWHTECCMPGSRAGCAVVKHPTVSALLEVMHCK